MTQDRFLSLDAAFQKRVADKLRKNFYEAAPEINADSWEKLKPVLAAYKRDAEFLRGFVNKGQVRDLNKVAKSAQRLLKDLDDIEGAGLGIFTVEALGATSIKRFRGQLQALSDRFKIEPRDDSFLKDTSRERLVEGFDRWWIRSTRQQPELLEGEKGFPPPTPYMLVANEVFNLPGMPQPTGSSYKALKDQRRIYKGRAKKIQRIAEHLNKLLDPKSDDG